MQGGSEPQSIRKLEKNDEETAEYQCSSTSVGRLVGIAVSVSWFVGMILDAPSFALLRRQETCCLVCLRHVAKTENPSKYGQLTEHRCLLRVTLYALVSKRESSHSADPNLYLCTTLV